MITCLLVTFHDIARCIQCSALPPNHGLCIALALDPGWASVYHKAATTEVFRLRLGLSYSCTQVQCDGCDPGMSYVWAEPVVARSAQPALGLQVLSHKRSIDRSINQSINQSINHSSNQSLSLGPYRGYPDNVKRIIVSCPKLVKAAMVIV